MRFKWVFGLFLRSENNSFVVRRGFRSEICELSAGSRFGKLQHTFLTCWVKEKLHFLVVWLSCHLIIIFIDADPFGLVSSNPHQLEYVGMWVHSVLFELENYITIEWIHVIFGWVFWNSFSYIFTPNYLINILLLRFVTLNPKYIVRYFKYTYHTLFPSRSAFKLIVKRKKPRMGSEIPKDNMFYMFTFLVLQLSRIPDK